MSDLVDFFIVGAMKSGTSSVRNALSRNPAIDMYPHEAHFFSEDEKYAEGIDAYHALFDFSRPYAARGEKSPPYGVVEPAARRIRDYNSDARIVWVLRSPVRRTISHFHHAKKRNPDAISIEEAIDRRAELEQRSSPLAYVYRSEYQKHLQRFVDLFGRERNYVIVFEELIAKPKRELRLLHKFLGVPFHPSVKLPHANKAVKSVAANYPVNADVEARLADLLQPTVAATEAFLARDIPAWRPAVATASKADEVGSSA